MQNTTHAASRILTPLTTLLIVSLLFHAIPTLAQTRYGSRFSTKENAAPARLILSDRDGNPISLVLSGSGHVRWIAASESDHYPYTAGLAGILKAEIELSRALKVDYEMDLRHPQLAQSHAASQNIYGRLAVHSIYDSPDMPLFGKLHTQMGNLGKITLGQGLTLKHMNADGVRILAFPKSVNDSIGSLTYISRGYGNRGQLAILGVHDVKSENGVYVMSRIDSQNTATSLGTLWGLFGRMPFMGIDVVYEGGLSTDTSRESGVAGMLSPRFAYKSPDTTLHLSTTLRGYAASYLAAFKQNHADGSEAFVSSPLSLLDEEEDYDNWRNILIAQSGTNAAAGSLAMAMRLDQRLSGILWGFTLTEWTTEQYSHQTRTHMFWTVGLKAVYSPDHTVYLAVSNKLLNGATADTTDEPVLQQVPMFVTVGMMYRF